MSKTSSLFGPSGGGHISLMKTLAVACAGGKPSAPLLSFGAAA